MNHSTNGLIAVTGATGEVGGRVARRLASRGLAQRLIVRNPKRTEAIPGADVRAHCRQLQRADAEALAADAAARGWGAESRPAPPPHRPARPAHRPRPCQLTTMSRPGSRPPAPSWPPPGSQSRSPR